MEFNALLYCLDITRIPEMAKRNTRMGHFHPLSIHDDRDGSGANYAIIFQPEQRLLVLAFRGIDSDEDLSDTMEDRDVRPDRDVELTMVRNETVHESFRVHRGFWERFVRYRGKVVEDLGQAVKALKRHGVDVRGLDVVVVGHSFGAPWAFLTAGMS